MAMNEKLVLPYAMTVADFGFGVRAENVLSERLGRVGTLDATIFDLGAARPVDVVAMLATDQLAGFFWNALFYNSLADAKAKTRLVGQTGNFPGWASAEAGKRYHRQALSMLATPITARFVRIESTRSCNVGRLVIGQAFTASDTADIGISYRVVDLGTMRRSSNALDDPTIRGKVLEYSWTWSWMSETEVRGALLDVQAYAGLTRNILAILNPDAPDLHNVIAYGKIVEEVEPTNVAAASNGAEFNAYEAKFRLQSRLILNL